MAGWMDIAVCIIIRVCVVPAIVERTLCPK